METLRDGRNFPNFEFDHLLLEGKMLTEDVNLSIFSREVTVSRERSLKSCHPMRQAGFRGDQCPVKHH